MGGFPWTITTGKDDGNSWSDNVSVATALGMIGMFGAAARSAFKGPALARKWVGFGSGQSMEPGGGCFGTLPMALLQTVAFMLVGAGAPGAPAVVIRWRPYFSVISIVGSLLAGLGTLVLAQQYALLFPTLMLTIIWLVVWLALGIALPSLARVVAIRKANAIIARRAADQPAEQESVPAETEPPQK